jgi:endogenous inhibitor of DNA gyrase (YacG/DUF329 family)
MPSKALFTKRRISPFVSKSTTLADFNLWLSIEKYYAPTTSLISSRDANHASDQRKPRPRITPIPFPNR